MWLTITLIVLHVLVGIFFFIYERAIDKDVKITDLFNIEILPAMFLGYSILLFYLLIYIDEKLKITDFFIKLEKKISNITLMKKR